MRGCRVGRGGPLPGAQRRPAAALLGDRHVATRGAAGGQPARGVAVDRPGVVHRRREADRDAIAGDERRAVVRVGHRFLVQDRRLGLARVLDRAGLGGGQGTSVQVHRPATGGGGGRREGPGCSHGRCRQGAGHDDRRPEEHGQPRADGWAG